MRWFSSTKVPPSDDSSAAAARETLQELFSSSSKHLSLPSQELAQRVPDTVPNHLERRATTSPPSLTPSERKGSDRTQHQLAFTSTSSHPSPSSSSSQTFYTEPNTSRLTTTTTTTSRWDQSETRDIPPLIEPASSSSFSSPSRSTLLSWTALPPCPIAGYRLTEEGLWDEDPHDMATTMTTRTRQNEPSCGTSRSSWFSPFSSFFGGHGDVPPHRATPVLLSASALKEVIHELRRLEQEAKMQVDEQLPDQVRTRSLRGLELAVNPCLLLTGIYLMTWKSAQLYRCAAPRHSVVLTKLLSMMRWHLSVREKEEVAKRHRRLMQATNARVSMCFSAGASLTAFALWTRPSSLNIDAAPEAERGKKVVAYQQHTSASLKWMWFVYYHHPAYAAAAKKDQKSRIML